MKPNKKEKPDTVHYIFTFFSLILLIICFGTHLFTGKSALLQFDSLAGSLVLGVIFIGYAIWFIYEDISANYLSVALAITANVKKNPTLVFILFYWIVLIIIPFIFNIL
ncbi:MAG: hypothetical protein ABIJ31_08390 [Pseudomonadota bacterium]